MKPILFNTEMVQAILERGKTVTRRCVKHEINVFEKNGETLVYDHRFLFDFALDAYVASQAKYKKGDVLYVRETWNQLAKVDKDGYTHYDDLFYVYKADKKQCDLYDDNGMHLDDTHRKWKPSIHMPKEAARLFLHVTNVRVERLQDMCLRDFINEGIVIREESFNDPENAYYQAKEVFHKIWNSTLKKDELDQYGWDANPYVWVYEFEVISKEEAMKESEEE